MTLKDHFMLHVTTEVNLTVFSIADRGVQLPFSLATICETMKPAIL